MVSYAVVRFGAEWGVLSERRRIGRFAAQDTALQLGIMLALEAQAAGHPVELLVQDGGGRLEPQSLSPSRPAASALSGSDSGPAGEQTSRLRFRAAGS
jgi:hypothetical protein